MEVCSGKIESIEGRCVLCGCEKITVFADG